MHKRLGYEDLGMSYESIVVHGEYWRLIVSQLSHIEVLHLVFNMTALWSMGFVERQAGMGVLYYMRVTLILLLFSGVVCLGFYYFIIRVLKREQYTRVTAVGYSCVVFGWMANLAVAQGVSGKYSFLGMGSIPMWVAPFGSLVLTSIIVPRASFIGHLSGMIVGYVVGLGFFDGLNTFWTASLGVWTALGVVVSLVKTRKITLPFVRLQESNDIETGNAVRIVDGEVIR